MGAMTGPGRAQGRGPGLLLGLRGDQPLDQLGIDFGRLADEAQVDLVFDHAIGIALGALGLLDRQQAGVLARQTDAAHVGFLAGDGDPVGDLFVHGAGQDHLGHRHGVFVRHAQAVDKGRLHARLVQHGADLRPAAVDHHGVHAHQLQQHHVRGELLRHSALAHGVAAVFDDHGLAVINLDIGQGFGERLRRFPAAFLGLPISLYHRARSIAPRGAGVTGEGAVEVSGVVILS